jgi:hypothetical protein
MSLLWFQRNPLPTDWVAQHGLGPVNTNCAGAIRVRQ